ncbi:MAG TPA: hypothetical protein VGJ70_01055, partial [Solirubrobacteraceae bacterium]
RRFLDSDPAPSLDLRVPYTGGLTYLRATGLSLRYALASIAAHHWSHVGEIETLRSLRGHHRPEVGRGAWGRDLI